MRAHFAAQVPHQKPHLHQEYRRPAPEKIHTCTKNTGDLRLDYVPNRCVEFELLFRINCYFCKESI
jgi:hypothetical protein